MHPKIYAEAEALESLVSEKKDKEYTFRSPQRDKWPAGLCALRKEFELGKIPRNTITQEDLFVGGIRRKSMASGACRVCSL